MDLRIIHPVPLAVHDVVPDFHVLDDLGKRQHACAERPRIPVSADDQSDSRRHFAHALQCDDSTDIPRVAFAQCGFYFFPDRIQFRAELYDICGR